MFHRSTDFFAFIPKHSARDPASSGTLHRRKFYLYSIIGMTSEISASRGWRDVGCRRIWISPVSSDCVVVD